MLTQAKANKIIGKLLVKRWTEDEQYELDALIDDIKASEAVIINNGGPSEQIAYILNSHNGDPVAAAEELLKVINDAENAREAKERE